VDMVVCDSLMVETSLYGDIAVRTLLPNSFALVVHAHAFSPLSILIIKDERWVAKLASVCDVNFPFVHNYIIACMGWGIIRFVTSL